ncbi:MAG: hydroxyacid dehydrogenase [Anaerolineaceae bacterium]|nr:hydroxyacid dehydrogenase [Anaerolineaceae bacterium]
MKKALYLLDSSAYDLIYGPEERADIARMVDVYASPQTAQTITENPGVLTDAEILFSGWGMPPLDAAFLRAAPNLKLVLYGSGSIRYFVTDESWSKGVQVVSAYAANAIPVVEYTLSTILLSLKRFWFFTQEVRRVKNFPPRTPVAGCYGSTVGLISLGMIGQMVAERLRGYEMKVIAYDPFVLPETAAALGVELVELDEIFRRSDVVSLHTPWLKETEGMITRAHLESMRPDSTFINSARGAVVREEEMIAVLQQRPDLYAVLDVTYPEPPVHDSPLYTLPNVILSPHTAGAMSNECRRMGRLVVDELRRYLLGQPLQWSISKERSAVLA